jgi:hypothetical protein
MEKKKTVKSSNKNQSLGAGLKCKFPNLLFTPFFFTKDFSSNLLFKGFWISRDTKLRNRI